MVDYGRTRYGLLLNRVCSFNQKVFYRGQIRPGGEIDFKRAYQYKNHI